MESNLSQIDFVPKLRPFPVVASHVLDAINRPNTSPQDLADLLTCDASIAMRILSVANSPLYGFSREIQTIPQAVVVLGNRSVRDVVLTVATADLFSSGTNPAQEALWNHSLGCASVAAVLALHSGEVSKDEAFLGGILHDVGKLVLYDAVPDDYQPIDAQSKTSTIIDSELKAFGISHQQLGQQCSEEWGLPDEIVDVIGFHHQPSEAFAAVRLTELIHCANVLSRVWQIGSEQFSDDLAEIETLLESFGAGEDKHDELRELAESEYRQLAQACSQ